MAKKFKMHHNSVLWFIEATLDCDLEAIGPWSNIGVKEAKEILNKCRLDTVCGSYCRRLIDSAATCLDRIRATLGDESPEVEEFTKVIVYTCIVAITG